jgi:hypothetical protein
MPVNLSPVLLEIILMLRMFPAPRKKPAAFENVGAAVIAEAAKALRIKRLDILWRFIFSKTNRSISHKFYAYETKAGYYINKFNKKAKI